MSQILRKKVGLDGGHNIGSGLKLTNYLKLKHEITVEIVPASEELKSVRIVYASTSSGVHGGDANAIAICAWGRPLRWYSMMRMIYWFWMWLRFEI